jgi:plastocyanin
MNKKILIIGLVILVVVVSSILATQLENNEPNTVFQGTNSTESFATVTMPIKSSRPGCDETNRCYIPSKISIKSGESVKWLNEDVAFHSVTSGVYENPNGMFDSGYLDPNQSFTMTFDNSGTYDYFCTLHPWMKGQVIVN